MIGTLIPIQTRVIANLARLIRLSVRDRDGRHERWLHDRRERHGRRVPAAACPAAACPTAACPAAACSASSPRVASRLVAGRMIAGGTSAGGLVAAVPAMLGGVAARVPGRGVVPRLMMARRGMLGMILVMRVLTMPFGMANYACCGSRGCYSSYDDGCSAPPLQPRAASRRLAASRPPQ